MVCVYDIHPVCVLSVCMVIGIAHGFIGSEKGPISRTTLSTMLRTWVRSSPYHAGTGLNLAARAGLPRAYATKPPKGATMKLLQHRLAHQNRHHTCRPYQKLPQKPIPSHCRSCHNRSASPNDLLRRSRHGRKGMPNGLIATCDLKSGA